jgi:hypothetical protein
MMRVDLDAKRRGDGRANDDFRFAWEYHYRPDNPPGVGRRLVHCDAEGTIRFYALRLDEVGFIKSRHKR